MTFTVAPPPTHLQLLPELRTDLRSTQVQLTFQNDFQEVTQDVLRVGAEHRARQTGSECGEGGEGCRFYLLAGSLKHLQRRSQSEFHEEPLRGFTAQKFTFNETVQSVSKATSRRSDDHKPCRNSAMSLCSQRDRNAFCRDKEWMSDLESDSQTFTPKNQEKKKKQDFW